MQAEVAEKLYSVKEYLAFEERAKNKHEYYNGKIIKMPGASARHNLIAVNVTTILRTALRQKGFFVMNSDAKIHIPEAKSFVYPDAVVVFEKIEYYEGTNYIITNPLLIVEIASPSTKKYDRMLKFQRYKTLSSFKEYVLIEQTQPWVIASHKVADRTWKDIEATSLDSSVHLQSVSCTLNLQDVYEDILFNKSIK